MIQLLKMIGPILDGFKKIQTLSPNQCPEILLKSSEDTSFQKLQAYLSETGFSTKSNSFLVKKNDFDNQETLHKYILIQEYKKTNFDEKAVLAYAIQPDNTTTLQATVFKHEEPSFWITVGNDQSIQITQKGFLLKVQANALKILGILSLNLIILTSKISQLLRKDN